jgi:hypothetical protein
MIRSLVIAGFLIGAATPAENRPVRDSDFRIVNIEARLLYERSGRLSVDVTADPKPALWNTIIGEGSAEENADDLLVTAVVAGPGEHSSQAPLTITAMDARGKILGTRRIGGMLLQSRTYRSLLLHDVGCAGTLKLTAQLGASRRTETIELACGE